MKKIAASFLFLFFVSSAFAQRTVVSGTVTDTSGLPYSGASLTATLSTPTGTAGAYLGGAQIAGTVGPVSLDSTGSFVMNLPDNTQVQCANAAGQLVACVPQTKWTYAVTLSPGVSPPVGTGPQTCSSGPLTITGPSQSVSSSLNACPTITNVAASANAIVKNPTAPQAITATNALGSTLLPLQINSGVVQTGALLISTADTGAGGQGIIFSVQDFASGGGPALIRLGVSGGGFVHLIQGTTNTDIAGLVTCAASTVTKTFSVAFTSTPVIVISDETTAGGARVSAKSASAFTVTCTGATDVVDYWVIGNPN